MTNRIVRQEFSHPLIAKNALFFGFSPARHKPFIQWKYLLNLKAGVHFEFKRRRLGAAHST
jgi:hypothetical protein